MLKIYIYFFGMVTCMLTYKQQLYNFLNYKYIIINHFSMQQFVKKLNAALVKMQQVL